MSRLIPLQFKLCNLTVDYIATVLPLMSGLNWKCIKCFTPRRTEVMIIVSTSTYILSLLTMTWICYYKRSTQSRKLKHSTGSWFYASLFVMLKVNYPENRTFIKGCSLGSSCVKHYRPCSLLTRASAAASRVTLREHRASRRRLTYWKPTRDLNTNTGDVSPGRTEPYTIKQRKHSL